MLSLESMHLVFCLYGSNIEFYLNIKIQALNSRTVNCVILKSILQMLSPLHTCIEILYKRQDMMKINQLKQFLKNRQK